MPIEGWRPGKTPIPGIRQKTEQKVNVDAVGKIACIAAVRAQDWDEAGVLSGRAVGAAKGGS